MVLSFNFNFFVQEQVHCIVGAVLDSLHSVAQQAVEKVQTTSARGTRSTRSGRGNAEVEAAQKLAQGIVQWIDQVDQSAVENEVMEVVQEQHWPVPSPPSAAVAVAEVPAVVPVPEAQAVAASVVASTSAQTVSIHVTAVAPVASPGSPYVAPKRKIGDITPGSVTRSASKAKRTAKESVEQILAETSIAESARKVQIKGLKDIKDALRIPPYVPSSSTKASAVSKTPSHVSQASPRANTVRPAFLHALGGKIPAFPSLQSAAGGATPSRAAVTSSNTSNSNNYASNSSNSSNANTTSQNRRSPLKALPLSLQQQILNSAAFRNRQNSENGVNKANSEQPVIDRAAKWMRPVQEESNSMRSVMEKRLSAMRYVLDYSYLFFYLCFLFFFMCLVIHW